MLEVYYQNNNGDEFLQITRDKDRFVFPEVPMEIMEEVNSICSFGRNLKTTEEMTADKAIGLLEEKLTDDEALENIDIFKPWNSGESLGVGNKRVYQGALYEVIQAHTSQDDWAPDKVPALFRLVGAVEDVEAGEVLDWIQPTGAHDAYKTGDKVRFEGKVYQSVIDANTWSPTEYPAGWEEVIENGD